MMVTDSGRLLVVCHVLLLALMWCARDTAQAQSKEQDLWPARLVDVEGREYEAFNIVFAEGKVYSKPSGEDGLRMPLSDVLLVEYPLSTSSGGGQENKKAVIAHLSNGFDTICGTLRGCEGDSLVISSAAAGQIRLSLEQLAEVRLGSVTEEKLAEMPQPADADAVLLDSGDTDVGVVEEFKDGKLLFRSRLFSGLKEYKLSEVVVVRFTLLDVPESPAEAYVRIECVDGCRISGRLLKWGNRRIVVRNFYEQEVKLRCRLVSSMWVLNGRAVFLSELEPLEVVFKTAPYEPERDFPSGSKDQVPVQFFSFVFRKDLSPCYGRVISLCGKRYPKGIGMHSYCRVSWELSEGYEKFVSLVGMDDEADEPGREPGVEGCADAFVLLDGKEAFAAKSLKLGQKPRQVKLPLRGTRKLTLVVDFGADESFTLDRISWAMARLLKKR